MAGSRMKAMGYLRTPSVYRLLSSFASSTVFTIVVVVLGAFCQLQRSIAQGAPDFNGVSNQTQTPMPGTGHDYQQLLGETVSFSTGAVSFKISFPVPKSRGITLPYAWTYNSSSANPLNMVDGNKPTWDAYWTQSGQTVDGWNISEGNPRASVAIWSFTPPPNPYQTFASCNFESGLTFTDSSGSMHNLNIGAQATSTTAPGYVQPCGTQPYVPPNNDGQVAGIPDPNTATNDLAGQSPRTGSFAVQDRDGTTYFFGGGYTPQNGAITLAPFIEDRNGNIISTTDTAGRTVVKINSTQQIVYTTPSSSQTFTFPKSITVGNLNYTAAWTTVSVGYGAFPISAGSGNGISCVGIPDAVGGTRMVLSSLALPNGQSFIFHYDNIYGLLSEIDYPDGGWVKYSWTVPTAPNELAYWGGMQQNQASNGTYYYTPINYGCGATYRTPVLSLRTVSFDGTNAAQSQTFSYSTTWDYASDGSINGWNQKVTTVTTTDNVAGLSATTKYTYTPITPPNQPFQSGVAGPSIPVERQIEYYDWGKSTTPIKTVNKTWSDQFTMTSETTTNATGKIAGTIYTYGSASNGVATTAAFKYLLQKDEYDYGSGALPIPGYNTNSSRSPIRTTSYGYTCCRTLPSMSAPYDTYTAPGLTVPMTLPPLLTSITVKDAGGNVVAVTKYGYDEGALTPVTATQHDNTNFGVGMTVRGNLTSVMRCLDANCTTGQKTTYTYDITGQPTSMTDACGNASCSGMSGSNHTTQFNFSDSPSGGNSAGNSNAYLTRVTDTLGYHKNFQYNYGTGYLTSTTDENNQTTGYQYSDVLDRPTEIDFPDSGKTTFSYDDAGASITTSKKISQSDQWQVRVAYRDGMFHTKRTQITSDPSGADTVDIAYDGEGRTLTVSNPYRTTPGASVTNYYDALGRKIQVKNQDGTLLQWCYDGVASTPVVGYCSAAQLGTRSPGTWVDFTDEKGNHWERVFNVFGDLTTVMEPNGSSQVPSMETDYWYDVLNNLTAVNQTGTSGSLAHTRSFQYNNLSQLISASNPETGSINYTYDANGNVSTKTSPAVNVTSGTSTQAIVYCYDNSNRLTAKLDATDPSACSSPSPGKVRTALAYDLSTIAGTQNTAGRVVDEKSYVGATLVSERMPYSYDAMGRLLHEKQSTLPNLSNGATYSLDYAYDLAGNLASYTNGIPSTPGAGSGPLTFIQQFDAAGRLATVTSSWSDSLHPSCLFSAQSTPSSSCAQVPQQPAYAPNGALQSAFYGSGFTMGRTFDSRLRVTGQSSTGGIGSSPTPGLATMMITGSEQHY